MKAKKNYLTILFVLLMGAVSFVCCADKPFVLLTMLFNETDQKRMEEYKTCIRNHRSHDLIDEIHVLYDTSKDDEINELLNFLYEQNVTVTFIVGRATYGDFFELANTKYPDRRIILTNADIYFNETLYSLEGFDLTNTLLTITRWNLIADGSKEVTLNYFTQKPDPGSHDTWIFKAPLNVEGSKGICLGIMGCDGSIAYLAQQAGVRVLNPCYSVECLHLHFSPVRHYWREIRYKGPLLNVPCGTLPETNKDQK